MLVLVVIAVALMVIISVTAVFIVLGKYNKEKKKSSDLETQARVEAVTGRPIPGSGVTTDEMVARLRADPHPAGAPEPPPNRSETGRNLTQPRPRSRSRQSMESTFSDMFAGLGEQMTQAFSSISQDMNAVMNQATQLANVSTSIARDAQTLIDLGVTPDQIVIAQTRSWNFRNIITLLGRGTRTLRLLETRHPGEYQNWGELVRRFMTMIQSGELTFRDNSIEVIRGQQSSTQPGVQARVDSQATKEPEKPVPTRFERDEVI